MMAMLLQSLPYMQLTETQLPTCSIPISPPNRSMSFLSLKNRVVLDVLLTGYIELVNVIKW